MLMWKDCTAGGKTAGTIVQGFQRNDTTSAAHAIANSTPNGQASDTLGQLYANGETVFFGMSTFLYFTYVLTCMHMHGRHDLLAI